MALEPRRRFPHAPRRIPPFHLSGSTSHRSKERSVSWTCLAKERRPGTRAFCHPISTIRLGPPRPKRRRKIRICSATVGNWYLCAGRAIGSPQSSIVQRRTGPAKRSIVPLENRLSKTNPAGILKKSHFFGEISGEKRRDVCSEIAREETDRARPEASHDPDLEHAAKLRERLVRIRRWDLPAWSTAPPCPLPRSEESLRYRQGIPGVMHPEFCVGLEQRSDRGVRMKTRNSAFTC
jgi:hypothetical protein